MAAERWNHNIHYHPLVLEAVPPGARRALDVGCGDGQLARELAAVVPEVTAIDLHLPSLEAARAAPGPQVDYVHGDVLTHPFAPGSFDLVASIATLHHLDMSAGLERLAELLRPGGVLVVVGLARTRLWSPPDLAHALAGVVADRWLKRTRDDWEHGAPQVWPPPETYASARRTARESLPGVRFRRHLLFRYSLTWVRPTA
jgi:2-polyprenyl-3-methyl-5-hydroxy-6-metoxy-1,4-benzoquinol methylase